MAAIYQWFEGVIAYQTLTTTLYPAESVDAVSFSADLTFGYLGPIDNDKLIMEVSLLSGNIYPALLTAPEQEDRLIMEVSLLSGNIYPALLFAPEQEDRIIMEVSLISGTLEPQLITAYKPDEGLLMSIDVDSAGCSLDLV